MNDDSKDPAKSGESSNIADSEDGAPLEADANAQGAGTGNGGGQSTAAVRISSATSSVHPRMRSRVES